MYEENMMRINNVELPLEDWRRNISLTYSITEDVIQGNDPTRDYKQINLDYVKNLLLEKIKNNKSCSILDNIDDNFINKDKNIIIFNKIDDYMSEVFEQLKKHTFKYSNDKRLDNIEGKMKILFNEKQENNKTFLEEYVFFNISGLDKNIEDNKKTIKIHNALKDNVIKLIKNVNKNEINVFNGFMEENNLLHLKNTINSERLIKENIFLSKMFGVEYGENDEVISKNNKTKLDEKLTVIQGMKDEFNKKLSKIRKISQKGMKKLLNIQTDILALEDMVVYESGFSKLGLFTSDITNAVSNREMSGTDRYFNTLGIKDASRLDVLTRYEGEKRVQEYKKLMFSPTLENYIPPELTPKWYQLLKEHIGGFDEETINSFRSDITREVDNIINEEGNNLEPIRPNTPTPSPFSSSDGTE